MVSDRLRRDRSATITPRSARWSSWPAWVERPVEALRALSPEGRDSFLYACSAVFAGVTAVVGGIPLYRVWGRMAVGPYVVAAGLMGLATVRRRRARTAPDGPMPDVGAGGGSDATSSPPRHPGTPRRWQVVRVAAFLIVLFGATIVPLTLEVIWRSEGNAPLHIQPEGVVVEQAGARAAHGKDPYQVVDRDGHILIHEHTEPIYELYYPYLPGMVIFGFSTGTRAEPGLTDARIQFLVFTALVTLFALSRIRPPTDARLRALEVLTVLPTAALPLATGGDDMPVAALMLLGLVALQRRRPVLAGLALGAASSLKFTAWPLALLVLFAAFDRHGRRAAGRYVLGVVAVMGPVVLPFALWNPTAFVDNVIRFPLGLAGVSSPAASALPGHMLVSALPGIHRAYVVALALVGATVLVWYLRNWPPRNASQAARVTGWVMVVAIMLAPATRVGYLLYPINLFVWSWMLSQAEVPPIAELDDAAADSTASEVGVGAGHLSSGQLSSGSSNSSTENDVVPAEVVGDTTTPTSQ
ncbi:MAG: glycosyltransferase family 87 protein [Acidimicrobiales bacterium]